MDLSELLRSLLPRNHSIEDDLRRIEGQALPQRLRKGDRLVAPPAVAGVLVTQGCLRAFFVESDGAERVLYFAPAGWWVPSSGRRAVAEGPGTAIDALEPSEVWTIEHSALMSAPALDHVRVALAERTLRALQQRLVGAMRKTAAERYYEFQRLYPGLEARISQYHIAEYLGVSPEFLSRLRTRLLRESHAIS